MDISLELENYILNVRTSALIKYKDEYLVCKHKNKEYVSLTGGRVKLGEDSKTAIIRELKEELNFDLYDSSLSLVRVVENYFTLNNKKYHEYLFIYEIELDDRLYNKEYTNLENPNINMVWVKKENFILMDIKPGLVKNILIDNNLKHLIYKD